MDPNWVALAGIGSVASMAVLTQVTETYREKRRFEREVGRANNELRRKVYVEFLRLGWKLAMDLGTQRSRGEPRPTHDPVVWLAFQTAHFQRMIIGGKDVQSAFSAVYKTISDMVVAENFPTDEEDASLGEALVRVAREAHIELGIA